MPLPERREGEEHKAFIQRCMADDVMVREFPDAGQRQAVCESQAKGQAQMAKSNEQKRVDLLCDAELQITAAAGQGESAALPTFHMLAYTGGPMSVGSFPVPVVIDLAGLVVRGQKIPIREGHHHRIGHSTSVTVDAQGGQIAADGVVSCTSRYAREVVADAQQGFPWQASIGARVVRSQFLPEKKMAKVNGRDVSGPCQIVREAILAEISFVEIGADMNTHTSVAAQEKENQNMSEQASGNDQPQEVVAEAKPAAVTPAVPDVESEIAARLERAAAIQAACGDHLDIAAKALREKWSVEKAQLEVMRAERPLPPDSGNDERQRESTSNAVLAAALCMHERIADDKTLLAEYGEQVVNDAGAISKCGLRGVVDLAARAKGREISTLRGSDWIRAAFSTVDMPGILGPVANKALAAAFSGINAVVPRIARTASHVNFHSHTVYSMALNGDLEEIAPDGELKHMNMSEESYTRQLKTRGAVLTITRQDLINDELGAFSQAAQAIGRKAAIARERAMFALFNATGAGASHFTTARGNYFEGAATNLQSSSLATAVQMFADQTGPDGDPILVEPKILLVPSALKVTAKELMSSQYLLATGLASTSAARRDPAQNVWQGAFEPMSTTLLGATYDDGSNTAWYLLADPADLPACEIAYLNGQAEPIVEYFGLDQNVDTLGVSWRCYYDFGCALAEYRAGLKSKGAA